MIVPSLAVLVPIAVALGLGLLMGGDVGPKALGGVLVGTIVTGIFVAPSRCRARTLKIASSGGKLEDGRTRTCENAVWIWNYNEKS